VTALGAFLTLATYYAYTRLYERKRAFYLNPVLLSIATISALLVATAPAPPPTATPAWLPEP